MTSSNAPALSAPRRGRQFAYAALAMCCAYGSGMLLAPESGWSRLSNLFDVRDTNTLADAAVPISDAEKNELVALTQSGQPLPVVEGDAAVKANAAIPFSPQSIAAARPFHLASLTNGNGLTALKCMTQAIYYEAGFEPVQGRRAVAQVVLNRMQHPAFPKSVCGVVYEGANAPVCQFSFTCDGALAHLPQPDAWRAAERIAREALTGRIEPSVGHATHYHADYVSPYWAPRLTKLSQIGAHIFYRWPGGWGTSAAFNGRYAGHEAIPTLLPRDNDSALASAADPTEALARATLAANLVPIRHAENDIGGRLDISKGWRLNIPAPSDTHRAAAAATARQQSTLSTIAATAATSTEGTGL